MLISALIASAWIWAPIVIGLVGTGLEATGNPVAVAVGKRLEAISVDLPKLLGKK